MKIKQIILLLVLLPCWAVAQIYVTEKPNKKRDFFTIVSEKQDATIYYEQSENILVKKTAKFLVSDIKKVTGKEVELSIKSSDLSGNVIIVTTEGSDNPLIKELVKNGKLKTSALTGQWERFIIKTIDKPFPNVKQALVILGSDRRGAAYGVFTLSKEMGVSPWYFWADVSVKR